MYSDYDKQQFGQLLKASRPASFTQARTAAALGVSKSTYKGWENGYPESHCDWHSIGKIIAEFGLMPEGQHALLAAGCPDLDEQWHDSFVKFNGLMAFDRGWLEQAGPDGNPLYSEARRCNLYIEMCRDALMLSQQEFADAVGVKKSTVVEWEAEGEPKIALPENFATILQYLSRRTEDNVMLNRYFEPDRLQQLYEDADRVRRERQFVTVKDLATGQFIPSVT